MIKVKFLILSFLVTNIIYSQNKTEMAIYNIGKGSFAGGVGAIINKKPNEKTGKVFLKGFLQGGVGGYLVYESKNFILKVSDNNKLEYAWGAKFINSIGSSIVENASLNQDFWNIWHFNVGYNRIEVHTKNKIKIKYKIMPVALLLTGIYAYGNKFELEKSLKTGEILFSLSKNFKHAGATWGKLILIDESWLDKNNLIAHEIIHSYQYEDFNFVNTFINKPKLELLNKSKLGEKLNNFFYFDLQAPIFGGLYLLEKKRGWNNYYDNFFEYEAGFFSNTLRLDD